MKIIPIMALVGSLSAAQASETLIKDQPGLPVPLGSTQLSHTFCDQLFYHNYDVFPAGTWEFAVNSDSQSSVPGPAEPGFSFSVKSKSYVYVGSPSVMSDIDESSVMNLGTALADTAIGSGVVVNPSTPVPWRSVTVLTVNRDSGCSGTSKIRVDGTMRVSDFTLTITQVQYIDEFD